MTWDRPPANQRARSRVASTMLVFIAVSLCAVVASLALVSGNIEGWLVARFGDDTADLLIDAERLEVEAILMSRDPYGDRVIVSYEYFVLGVLYVGYAPLDSDVGREWKRLKPLVIEVADVDHSLSRPMGSLAPRGWVTRSWRTTRPYALLVELLVAGGLVLLSIRLRR